MNQVVMFPEVENAVKNDALESVNVFNFANSEKERLDELFFADVRKVKAKDLMPGFDFCSYNNHLIEVTIDDNPMIINNVSENYLLLPNKEIFPALEKNFEKFGSVDIKREVKNFGQFFVDYTFNSPESRIELVKNETLLPKIQIQNSYNSRGLYGIRYGVVRMICTNGLTIPVTNYQDIELSHCKNNLNLIIEETLEKVGLFLNTIKEQSQKFEPLFEKKIEAKQVEEVVEHILKKANYMLSYKDSIVERIKRENSENNVEFNLWSVYNGINYMLQPQNNSKLSASADIRMKADQKILNLVYSMAV